ncbi:hypothetical protein HDV02_002227 [Globomyces sp. JEL0801]|nr:hypothetical protein HDV02_002227 [Globomyces sp. JEL0801]
MKMMNQLKNELQSQKDLTAKLQLALEYEKNLHRENNIQNQAISNTTTPEDKRISELERKVIDFQIQEKIHLNLIQSEKLKNTALAKELRDERSRQLRLQQKVIPESLSPLSIHRIIPQPNISTSTLEQLAKQIKSHCEFNRDLFTFIKPFLISCKEITQQCDDRISQSFSDQDSIDKYQEQISIYLSKLMKLVKLHHDSENPSMHLDIQNTVDFILNTIVKMVLVIERETFNQVIIDKELESSAMQRLKRLSKRHTTSSLVIHYDPVPDQASLSISQLQKFLKSQIDRLDHEIKPVLDHFSPSDISTQISTISDIVDGILYESRSTSDTYHFNTQHELLELLTLLGDTHLTLLHRCESINTDSGSLSIHDMLLDLLKV